MISRAIREGWNVNRQMVVDALEEVIRARDPDLMLNAAELLLKADALDVKREEMELKKSIDDDARRLQLLELAQSVPVDELTRIASENGIFDSVEVPRQT